MERKNLTPNDMREKTAVVSPSMVDAVDNETGEAAGTVEMPSSGTAATMSGASTKKTPVETQEAAKSAAFRGFADIVTPNDFAIGAVGGKNTTNGVAYEKRKHDEDHHSRESAIKSFMGVFLLGNTVNKAAIPSGTMLNSGTATTISKTIGNATNSNNGGSIMSQSDVEATGFSTSIVASAPCDGAATSPSESASTTSSQTISAIDVELNASGGPAIDEDTGSVHVVVHQIIGGYRATISLSKKTLLEASKQFVYMIKNEGYGSSSAKPLVFVSHSLNTYSLLSNWIFKQGLPPAIPLPEMQHLYFEAARFKIYKLANYIADRIQNYYLADMAAGWCFEQGLWTVYQHTPAGNPLRRLYLEIVVGHLAGMSKRLGHDEAENVFIGSEEIARFCKYTNHDLSLFIDFTMVLQHAMINSTNLPWEHVGEPDRRCLYHMFVDNDICHH